MISDDNDNNNNNNRPSTVSEGYQLINQCNDIAKLIIALSSSSGSSSSNSSSIEDDSSPSSSISTNITTVSTDIGNMRMRLILSMAEPSVEDVSKWVNWFDNLAGMKQYLETEVSLLLS